MDRPRSPLRFLIVEDEAILAMDIGTMVEDAGHRVVGEAASLREVQMLGDGITPDIAFVDLQLAEGSSGLDVCAHIHLQWAAAVIVFVTANPKKLPADNAGAHGVISKPFSRNGLKSAMRYLTEGICNPPPSSMLPAELTTFPVFEESWSL